MIQNLKETKVFFASTEREALDLIQQHRDKGYLTEHSIRQKFHKKSETEWYEVKVVEEYQKAADILSTFE